MKNILLLAGLLTAAAQFLQAQAPATTPARATANAPILSPEIHPDRTVTFRLRATNATSVAVNGQWGGGTKAMTRDERGVWQITIGPVPPEIYEYSFIVDGTTMIDPGNREIKPMRSPRTSILEVPGNPPLIHDFQNVPHGAVRLHWYDSKALGRRRALQVYTPPGYDRGSSKYPVLYLFHGSGDNEATWVAGGKAHWILDNLIASKKAVPMVVVMTDGHAAPPAPPGGSTDGRNRNIEAFESDLLQDVLPLVESTYRVRKDAASRAIIGLSMGGGQSLSIGLRHADTFAWVGGMSSAVFNPRQSLEAPLGNAAALNKKLKALWFACGKDDFLLKQNQDFSALLKEKGIPHLYLETAGNHSWPVWRKYLADYAPTLFR